MFGIAQSERRPFRVRVRQLVSECTSLPVTRCVLAVQSGVSPLIERAPAQLGTLAHGASTPGHCGPRPHEGGGKCNVGPSADSAGIGRGEVIPQPRGRPCAVSANEHLRRCIHRVLTGAGGSVETVQTHQNGYPIGTAQTQHLTRGGLVYGRRYRKNIGCTESSSRPVGLVENQAKLKPAWFDEPVGHLRRASVRSTYCVGKKL